MPQIDSLPRPCIFIMEGSNCATVTGTDALATRLRLELKEWEQSFVAAHQGRKAGREDIKQHPEIGQKLSSCYLSHSSTDATKHSSTSSTIDCADPLQNNLPRTTLLRRKSALLPTQTLFPHPTPHTSVRSTSTPFTPQRFAPMLYRLLRTYLLRPDAHRSGPHLRRMAKSSGYSINFLQPQTRRHLPTEKHFDR